MLAKDSVCAACVRACVRSSVRACVCAFVCVGVRACVCVCVRSRSARLNERMITVHYCYCHWWSQRGAMNKVELRRTQ